MNLLSFGVSIGQKVLRCVTKETRESWRSLGRSDNLETQTTGQKPRKSTKNNSPLGLHLGSFRPATRGSRDVSERQTK